MRRCSPLRIAAALVAGIAYASVSASAAEQLLSGTKLVVKRPSGMPTRAGIVHLAKDPSIATGAAGGPGDPQCSGAGAGGSSSLRIVSNTDPDVTIPLPCTGWTTNRANSLYKYKDRSGATCKVVLVKNGKLTKAVCKGTHAELHVTAKLAPVAVVTTLNDDQYCTEFGGTATKNGSDGKTLLHKNAPPPSGCPPPACVSLTKWGSFGTGNSQFDDTQDVAIDGSGNVYVADRLNRRVQKFTTAGTFITAWPVGGLVAGIAVDASGQVYVSDESNGTIKKFTSSGTVITQWSAGIAPGELAVDSSGNVYVPEAGSSRIEKFTGAGVSITAWGSLGSGPGQFHGPVAVAVDAANDVYVVDAQNSRVQKFTSGGTFITQWGTSGGGSGEFNFDFGGNFEAGIAVDASGHVYVADYGNVRMQEFTSGGSFVRKWGSAGSGDGQLAGPSGVDVDSTGNIYVVESGNNDRVQKFSCP